MFHKVFGYSGSKFLKILEQSKNSIDRSNTKRAGMRREMHLPISLLVELL